MVISYYHKIQLLKTGEISAGLRYIFRNICRTDKKCKPNVLFIAWTYVLVRWCRL